MFSRGLCAEIIILMSWTNSQNCYFAKKHADFCELIHDISIIISAHEPRENIVKRVLSRAQGRENIVTRVVFRAQTPENHAFYDVVWALGAEENAFYDVFARLVCGNYNTDVMY